MLALFLFLHAPWAVKIVLMGKALRNIHYYYQYKVKEVVVACIKQKCCYWLFTVSAPTLHRNPPPAPDIICIVL